MPDAKRWLEPINRTEVPDVWVDALHRAEGPIPMPKRMHRGLRVAAILVAAAVVLGLALYGLWGLDGNGAQPMTGPTEPLSTSMDPAKIPISVRYPADWYAAVGSTSPMLTGVNNWIGLVISNEARAVPAAHPANHPAYFRVHPDLPPTYVTVQILRRDVPALHGPPVPETPLPLSMTNATATSGLRNFRYLTAQIDGTPVFISVEAGPDASAADLARADQIVASIRSAEGPLAPLSFAPADGWYDQAYSHKPGSSDPSQAWTSNMPFASDERPPVFPDTSSIADGEVLVLARQIQQGPPDPTNPNFPVIQGPVQLADPTTGYEGMAPGVTRSMMLAQIDGRYVQVEVYFGSQDPRSDMKAAAQSALDRLVVNPYLKSAPTRRKTHASTRSVPTCAPNGQPWASPACPESVWLRKVITAAGAQVNGLTQTVEPQHRSAFLVSFDGYAFSMGAISRRDFHKMGGYFSMGEFGAGMQDDGMVNGVQLFGNVDTGHWSWETPSGYTVEMYPPNADPHHHVPQSVVAELISATLSVP